MTKAAHWSVTCMTSVNSSLTLLLGVMTWTMLGHHLQSNDAYYHLHGKENIRVTAQNRKWRNEIKKFISNFIAIFTFQHLMVVYACVAVLKRHMILLLKLPANFQNVLWNKWVDQRFWFWLEDSIYFLNEQCWIISAQN